MEFSKDSNNLKVSLSPEQQSKAYSVSNGLHKQLGVNAGIGEDSITKHFNKVISLFIETCIRVILLELNESVDEVGLPNFLANNQTALEVLKKHFSDAYSFLSSDTKILSLAKSRLRNIYYSREGLEDPDRAELLNMINNGVKFTKS